MRKRGLTIVELLIAMVLLAIIMAAVSGVFSVALKNYRVSFAQSGLQRELNLVTDSIARDIKQSVAIPESYAGMERSSTLMILALPAIDEDEDFIYAGEVLEKDYIIYSLNEDSLEKTIFASALSSRYSENSPIKTLLEDILSLSFFYTPNSPGAESTKADISITVSKEISNTNLSITASNSANKRNDE